MASIVLTQVNEFTGERVKKVIDSSNYDFIYYRNSRYTSVTSKGSKKVSFNVIESLGEITKLINSAEDPMVNKILKNQEEILKNQKKILAMLEVLFE